MQKSLIFQRLLTVIFIFTFCGSVSAATLKDTISQAMQAGRELVSASFVTPYPPGFPVLVPGQVVSEQILAFIRALDVKEIHGYEPEIGLQLFTEAALAKLQE